MQPERYLRHALIDWFPQERVRAARIAVVGAGAVGNEVVKNLALLGAGAIDIFDFDRVELHNLTRSIFLRESDVGRAKAGAVAERATEVDPSVAVRAIEGDFWLTLALHRLRHYDCAVACVDNFEARIRLNQMCLVAGVDLVNTGVDSRYAAVEVFPLSQPEPAACYECGLPDSAYRRIAERYSCGWLRKRAATEQKVPTTAITASIAGALAASAALRLGPETDIRPRRILVDTIGGAATVAALVRREACAGCGAFTARPWLVAARNDWRARLAPHAGLDDVVVRLSDPIITGFACAECGDDSGAAEYCLRRAGDFDDRITVCAACGRRAVRIEIRDQLTLGELAARFDRRPLPAKFVLVRNGASTLCIDLEETNDGERP